MPQLQPPGRNALIAEDAPAPVGPSNVPSMPNLPANRPFLLKHHPLSWGVMDGRLVPLLKTLRLEAGLSGVDKSGDYRRAKADQEGRGWTFIPLDVDGPGTTYCKRYQVPKGYHHTEPFASVWAGTDAVECDTPAYADWLESLVERGFIKPPPAYALRKLIEQKRLSVASAADRVATMPSSAADVERGEREIAILEAKLAEVTDAAKKAAPLVPDNAGPKPRARKPKVS